MITLTIISIKAFLAERARLDFVRSTSSQTPPPSPREAKHTADHVNDHTQVAVVTQQVARPDEASPPGISIIMIVNSKAV